MLAGITWNYVADWVQTAPTFTPTPTFGTSGATHTYGNTEKGVLVVTIDGSIVDNPATPVNEANGHDVYLRVNAGNYVFASDPTFANTIVAIPSGFDTGYSLQTKDPDTTVTPTIAASFTSYTAAFDTIYVRTVNLVDGTDKPSFTIVGASQDVAKSLVVDLTASGTALSGSKIDIGAPVIVAADAAGGAIGYQGAAATSPEKVGGAIYMAAESISMNAVVSSRNNLTLTSAIGADNQANSVIPQGVVIRNAVTGFDTIDIDIDGTAFLLAAGGRISGPTSATAATDAIYLRTRDADAVVEGKIYATDQFYDLRESAGAGGIRHSLTTISPTTGANTGSLIGDNAYILLSDQSGGAVNLQSSIDLLRITAAASTPANALDYDITVTNDKSLFLDAISASAGDIALTTTSGTITLAAVIDTPGSLSLTSADDLTVSSAIKSGKSISLASTAGSVASSADVETAATATNEGAITITAAKNVTIDSRVEASAEGVFVTAGGTVASGKNLASDPTARLTGPSATLLAGSGIDLGTAVDSLSATVTGAGNVVVSDAGGTALDLTIVSTSTADGSISISSARSLAAATITAGGIGDVTLTSTGGDIDVGSVVADSNAVILKAVGYAADGTTVVHAGTITGNAPTSAEIAWTAFTAPADTLYRSIPTISATLLGPGDIDFTTDSAVTLKAITTTDGGVNVTSLRGSVTASGVYAGNGGDISLAAADGDLFLGTIDTDGRLEFSAGANVFDTDTDDVSLDSIGINPDNANLIINPGFEITAGLPVPTGFVTSYPYGFRDINGGYYPAPRYEIVSRPPGGGEWVDYAAHEGQFFFLADGSQNVNDVVWQMVGAGNVYGGIPYQFEAYVSSVFPISPARLSFQYSLDDGATWNVLAEAGLTTADGVGLWKGIFARWTPATDGEAIVRLVNANAAGRGNDFGVDCLYFGPTYFATVEPLPLPTPKTVIRGGNTIITAGSDIGKSINRLDLDVSSLLIASSQTAYLSNDGHLTLNATTDTLLDLKSVGATSDIDVQTVTVAATDGQVTLTSGRDLTVGRIQIGGGAFEPGSKISLTAAGVLRNIDPADPTATVLEAVALALSAASLDGSFDVSNVDAVNQVSAAATASGGSLNLTFDRATAVTLDGVTTVSGNIAIRNLDAGDLLIGSGGITAGTATTNNSVTISSLGNIAGADSLAGTDGGAFGIGPMAAPVAPALTPAALSATMTSGWERVAPLGRLGTSTSIVSWQGTAATAFTDRWVVKASDPAITSQSLTAAFKSRTATRTWTATSLGEGYYSIVAPKAVQASVLAWANATPGIAFAQPDFVITTAAVPNDPSYGQLWGLNNPTNPTADIDAPAAWDITTGSRSTAVAVIDTGVDYNHPDLAANMWRNPGEIPGDRIDNDGNGFIDDVYGWDFFNNDADPMDDHSHGTHCAGTIGAVGNNGVGVAGVNWQVSIMAMKFMGASNSGPLSAAISSLNYVTMMRRDHGVNVVATNNSWGGGGYNETLKDAIKAGGDAGILFIAAAGNDANDNDALPTYPASYDDPSIIAVAATDSSNNLASFSNYGAMSGDVGAPGVGILSTVPGGGYGLKSGTSMATPHVAGIAALLASAYPNATASQIKSAILSSTVAIPALAGKVATGGLVNAPAALAALGAIAGGGTITAGGLVTLNAVGDITASTAAGQLAATSGGTIEISQSGDVKVAGITAATSATLDVAGAVLAGTGSLMAPLATVKATNSIDLKTDVTTLSAVSSGGNVTVVEANGLEVGADGIKASGTASITLTTGNLDSSGGTISGTAVGIKLLAAGDLDVDTSAGSLTASTTAGNISIRNDKSFNIGAAGIVVGNPATDDITLSVKTGGITTGTGSLKADALAVSATTGIVANTSANSLTATSTSGAIAITQTGKAVTLTSLVAANGGVAVTANDDVTVTNVQALGSGKNVSITTTGTGKNIDMAAGGIVADGDSVTLLATGAINGSQKGATPDVKAATATLTAGGGNLEATLQATTATAKASGNVDVTLLGSKAVFLTPTSGTVLSAGGNVTLRTGSNNVVVVAAPAAGAGKTTTYETTGMVTFAVTGTAATGAGSLAKAVADASSATIVGGSAGVAFSTAVTGPIQLTGTIDIANKLSIDGTQRINVAAGSLTLGSRVNIDGSRLSSTSSSGFRLTTNGASSASGSSLRGLAFYGFSRGAAVEITPAADSATISGVTIQGNLFGTGTSGLVSANKIGILAQNTAGGATKSITGLTITDNTIVRSTDAGIRLGAMVANAAINGNLIGTNSARLALGNALGIDIAGAGAGNTVGAGNIIANNTTAGVRVSGTDASGGTATTIRGSELLQNAVGILVSGATKNVDIAGNTITRSTADGIRVTDTASNVSIGGVALVDRNFIGTTVRNALGLGNARNGVSVSSAGTGITIQNNAILGNGTANVANDNAGVKLSGTDASTALAGNAITSNRGAGVLALGNARATLTRNTISSNTGSGVQVTSGTLVVGGDRNATDASLRLNANTLESNGRYGVEVLAGAFAQIAGNVMNVNRLGGVLNPNAATGPTIGTATRSTAVATNGLLTVTFTGLANGDVVHVYTGSAQGRVYLGKFTATGAAGTFTMTLAQQNAAGVTASVFAGAPITAAKTTALGNTSPFAAAKTIARA